MAAHTSSLPLWDCVMIPSTGPASPICSLAIFNDVSLAVWTSPVRPTRSIRPMLFQCSEVYRPFVIVLSASDQTE